VTHVSGEFELTDHDEVRWLTGAELREVEWAPADIPLLESAYSLLDEK
jgi:8-oxo-dGTP diphosphatase